MQPPSPTTSSPFASLRRALVVVAFLAVSLSAAVGAGTANAATASFATASFTTAEESAIAVPFVGDYEMWCTDRNPAPGNRCSRHHGSPAIDLGMDPGTPLYAAGNGTVIDAQNNCPTRGSCNNGKGNNVVIAHADGSFSRYLHMGSVSVSIDQVVTVGDRIGTSGETGQWSSPHLHYDEHFPFGTRTDMGKWIGCVDGSQVIYPDVFGTTDWNEVSYGERIVNEGFDCLDGYDTDESLPRPRIIAGTTHFGITAPTEITKSTWQASIDRNNGAPAEIVGLSGTTLVYRAAPSSTVSVRIRQFVKGAWTPWSATVDYDPTIDRDQAVCIGLYATTTSMTGTPDVDVIVGTDGDDTINARRGDDVICANDGNDTVIAGYGKDRVYGGAGNDTISGGLGFDLIRGDAGNDVLTGGNGRDTVIGGPGNDDLQGNFGNDTLEGGNGDDTLIGGVGHDRLVGGADNDELQGRNGLDVLVGGNGDDELLGGNGLDRLNGGAGADTLTGGGGSDLCISDDNDSVSGCER